MDCKSKLAAVTSVAIAAGLFVAVTPSNAGSFAQKHPRRAEVLHRDNNLNNRINGNRGNLTGHYNKLERQDRMIRRQEQLDAKMNGGHITKSEQHQLNHEENHVSNEIKRDKN